MPVTSGTSRALEGTSLPGRIVITQKSTEISSTARIATPAQIQATGGPAWVRFIVVSVLSWRSERAVSAACFGFGPYSSLVSAPTARLDGDLAAHRRVERLAEGRGILVSLEGILREGAQDDGVERARHGLVDLGRRHGRFAHVLVGDGDRRLAAERRPAGEQLVEHDARRVDVGARVDRLALGLLGREVRGGAEDGRRLGDRRGRVRHRAGDAEVHDLDLAGIGDHHVAGLDVAVDDAGAVGVLERLEDAVDVAHRVCRPAPGPRR